MDALQEVAGAAGLLVQERVGWDHGAGRGEHRGGAGRREGGVAAAAAAAAARAPRALRRRRAARRPGGEREPRLLEEAHLLVADAHDAHPEVLEAGERAARGRPLEQDLVRRCVRDDHHQFAARRRVDRLCWRLERVGGRLVRGVLRVARHGVVVVVVVVAVVRRLGDVAAVVLLAVTAAVTVAV